MAFFEEMVIKDSIEIKTTAEKVFNFITSIIDDKSYKQWHTPSIRNRMVVALLTGEGSIWISEAFLR